MAQRYQDYIKLNDKVIVQPDEGLQYSFETTYTEDSTRVQSGRIYATPMFTVESFGYTATWVPAAEMTKILQIIDKALLLAPLRGVAGRYVLRGQGLSGHRPAEHGGRGV